MVKIKLIRLILISLIILLAVGGASAATFRSYIDQDYGFYRVIVLKDNVTNISYINKILNINIGDTVVWMNDATPDEELNVVSDQGLWNGTARLRWNYQIFNYTFNDSGVYTFHIKEYPRLKQTIIVNNITSTITPNATQISTPTVIPTVNMTNVNKKNETTINETATPQKKSPGLDIMIVIITILSVYKVKKLRMR